MKRVLIVAYYFPPLGGIGSLRVTNFARHLPDYGWQPTVLAPRDGAYFRDESLSFPEADVIRTGSMELSRAGKRLLRTGGTDVRETSVTGTRALLKDLARRYVYFPDAQIGWLPSALLTARRRVRRTDYDAIFSSSFPITAHLVARHLHRRLDVPWIAEFRDPWTALLPESSPGRRRAVRLETAIGREASAVVTVSPSWAEMFGSSWGRVVSVVRNGHDGGPLADAPKPDSAFTLAYMGTFYPDTQDLSAIWSAVAELQASAGLPVEAIRFIGEAHPVLLAELAARGLGALATSTGFLPHDQAVRELMRATVLLVAGPRDDRDVLRGHVVAKLPEYLATGRPVIYVGHPDSDAAGLLSRYPGTHVISGDDVAAAIEALRGARTEQFIRNVDDLSRHALTARLAALLDEVAA